MTDHEALYESLDLARRQLADHRLSIDRHRRELFELVGREGVDCPTQTASAWNALVALELAADGWAARLVALADDLDGFNDDDWRT